MSTLISGSSLFVEANGLNTHLLSYGDKMDTPVIILPGITSPAATAGFLANRISQHGYCVYVPDLRGRGQTDIPPAGSYRMENYAADVAGMIECLDLDKPIIIGHSLGARIAAAYVTTYASKEHGPLVLVDPPLSGPGRSPYPTNLESFMSQLREAKEGTSLNEVRRFYPKWPEKELQIRIDVLPSCDETAIRETHAGFNSEDFFPYWKNITQPCVLLYGGLSPVVTAQGVADLAAANPQISLISVPEAGHMIPWDNEEGFFKILFPALKDLESTCSQP